MIRRPPRSKRTDTLLPYTTLFRSACHSRYSGRVAYAVDRSNTATPADPVWQRRCSREPADLRSEEHTSELQSLMRISYAVFCLKKKKKKTKKTYLSTTHTYNHNYITHYTQIVTNTPPDIKHN